MKRDVNFNQPAVTVSLPDKRCESEAKLSTCGGYTVTHQYDINVMLT